MSARKAHPNPPCACATELDHICKSPFPSQLTCTAHRVKTWPSGSTGEEAQYSSQLWLCSLVPSVLWLLPSRGAVTARLFSLFLVDAQANNCDSRESPLLQSRSQSAVHRSTPDLRGEHPIELCVLLAA